MSMCSAVQLHSALCGYAKCSAMRSAMCSAMCGGAKCSTKCGAKCSGKYNVEDWPASCGCK